jgi:hypothetical protein
MLKALPDKYTIQNQSNRFNEKYRAQTFRRKNIIGKNPYGTRNKISDTLAKEIPRASEIAGSRFI